MGARDAARRMALRVAPGLLADRARRHERDFRETQGVTALAHRMADDGAAVRHGPFAGLRFPHERLADVNAPVAKLLGAYEAEILGVFEAAIEREIRCFVDVGCADGYFAVGMAVAAPAASTFAYDIAGSARAVCHELAELNGVADRVHIDRWFDMTVLDAIPAPDLVLCDIEGAERELFTPALAARLRTAHVLVELHEHEAPGAGQRVGDAFAATHDARVVEQQPRDPGAYAELRDWTADERRAALSEHRPPGQRWMAFSPR